MLNLSIPTFLRNAASVLVRRHGLVAQQARQVGCSRQAVYNDARELCERLAERDRRLQRVESERDALQEELQRLRAALQQAVPIDEQAVRRFAVTAQASGISLRQVEELLGTMLPAERVPDHSTMGRWTVEAGRRAAEVLAVLDPMCAPSVHTLCIDEIFFGG
jgi:hypothetical protein